MMRKLICMCIAMAMTVAVYAVEKIAGETVSFFQTPTKGIVFDYADVYVTQDVEYAQKNQTYQKNYNKFKKRRYGPPENLEAFVLDF